MDILSFSDGTGESDNDPAVKKSVEIFSVARSDTLASRQEKETKSVGGTTSR
ncbi:MAG: hypothetical protein ACTSW7_04390 [Candidatus Thorarchaeota archaeon]